MTLLAYFVNENINYLHSLDNKVNGSTFHVVLVCTIKSCGSVLLYASVSTVS